jgi:hypothetical protein
MLLAHPWPGPSIFMPPDFYNLKCYPCLFAKYHISSSKLSFAKEETGSKPTNIKMGKIEKNVLLEEDTLGERDQKKVLKDEIEERNDRCNQNKIKTDCREASSFFADPQDHQDKEQNTRSIKTQQRNRPYPESQNNDGKPNIPFFYSLKQPLHIGPQPALDQENSGKKSQDHDHNLREKGSQI